MQDIAERNQQAKRECSRMWGRNTLVATAVAAVAVAVLARDVFSGAFAAILTFIWLNLGVAFMLRTRDTGSHLDHCEAIWQGWLLAAFIEVAIISWLF